MKKIFGFTIGGLQHKILALVLVVLLLTVSCGLIISALKSNNLTSIVESARNAQQEAIENVSKDTMHQVVESTMSKSNALQARIADDLFSLYTFQVFGRRIAIRKKHGLCNGIRHFLRTDRRG